MKSRFEVALFIERNRLPAGSMAIDRIYFGHETCQDLLPSPLQAYELATRCIERNCKITLVTPFLRDTGLSKCRRLIDSLVSFTEEIEIVCSDWGLLNCLCNDKISQPIISRYLCGQHVDPRLDRIINPSPHAQHERLIRHVDGTLCQLKYKKPHDILAGHYRSISFDRKSVIEFFSDRGVKRCEISNAIQGIDVSGWSNLSYSLHVSDVPIALMKRCPGEDEDFRLPAPCGSCSFENVEWQYPDLPVKVFRKDNALYYSHSSAPLNLNELPIDRLIYRINDARAF